MHPVVSVIIPAHNTAAYIAKAIESALQQTLKEIEVIVIDDGSTDDTLAVVQSFQDERLKVIANGVNCGATASSNRGIEAAKGEWVTPLDSDDWMAPERLERMVAVARAEQADILADDLYLIQDGEAAPWSTLLNESDHPISGVQVVDPVFFVKTDVYGKRSLHLGITKPLFRRSFLMQHGIRYDTSIKSAYDFWIDLDCLLHGARFILLPEPYYFYRARPGSAVYNKRIGWLTECCQSTEKFIRRPEVQQNPALLAALTRHLARFRRHLNYYRVVEPLKQKQYASALKALLQYPGFFVHLLKQIPGIVRRRIQYYVLRDSSAYGIFPKGKRFSKSQI